MDFLTGGSKNTWQPMTGADTTTSSYWLNWRVFLCCIGSLLSIYGCCQHHNKVGGDRSEEEQDEEQAAQAEITNLPNAAKYIGPKDPIHHRQVAGFWGYVFQIMFQMQAGAVVLTDCVFWFIIVPFLAMKDYNFNFFIINMHSINAVFLLGETALNSLVLISGIIAHTMLWNLCSSDKTEAFSLVEMVS
ncbi:hypothetical protein E3N88_39418 [Mikania micrantha]|uniref:Uncharacterized protein n=1 Tax=Mikania micrantha TaxID=192012 RepID=A0A5N6LX35_9ASTR|nr:hypothetical protein E3N88_39418 [Mikania micrantha]